jgi:hypothetical protein
MTKETDNKAENKVINKIKKALKIAEGSKNPEEAQTAMLTAQKLLAKHGLSMSDVKMDEVKKEVTHEGIGLGKNLWYEKGLAAIIGENFRCYSYISHDRRNATRIVFMGLKEDVEIAKEVFGFAVNAVEHHARRYVEDYKRKLNEKYGMPDTKDMTIEEIEKFASANYVRVNYYKNQYGDNEAIYKMRLTMALRKQIVGNIKTAGIKNDFIKGFLKGLQDKFKEQVAKESFALVLVKDEVVQSAYNSIKFRKADQSSVKSEGSFKAYQQGYEQGKTFVKPSGLIK